MDSQGPTPYQSELKTELERLNPVEFAHATRLVAEETKRVESGDKYKCVPLLELHHDRPSSNAIKIRIPIKDYPKVNFVGKLLGPKGNTLKGLQEQTGCKLSILGRGSMRDKEKEEELRKEGGKYSHLNEALHVMVECFAETVDAYTRITHAVTEIKKFMVPDVQEGGGMLQQPMEQMQFMNGGEGRGRGRGMPAQRGAPSGRGLLSTPGTSRGGMAPPSARGSPMGGRGAPGAQRGMAAPRGSPAPRGAPAMRGAPSLGGDTYSNTPTSRGAMGGRGAPRGMMSSRGTPVQRGRGTPQPMAAPSRPQALLQDYDDYGAVSTGYEEPAYGQETQYDDGYGARDPYMEETAYQEPAAAGGDTQFFDYGHGAGGQTAAAYDDYREPAPQRSVGYERSLLKASPAPSRGSRGGFRSHPYEGGRTGGMQSRY